MNVQEMTEHLQMKEKHVSYPKLPKFILSPALDKYKVHNKGHVESVIRGFQGRVDNWKKDHSIK